MYLLNAGWRLVFVRRGQPAPAPERISAPRLRRIGILLALCLAMFPAIGQPGTDRPLRTLVHAREVHNLSPEEAARAWPVHLRAVVTYFDPVINPIGDLFIKDATGSIFVEFSHPPHLDLHAGDLVDVTGVSGPGEFAPVINRPVVRAIGRSSLPKNATKATFGQLLSGSLDGQWVETEGVVHAVHYTPADVTLDMTSLDGSIRAMTRREPGANYESLVDSLIRLHGNACPLLNWKQQMVEAQILFPSLREVRVLKPAPRDPFALPAVPLSQVMRFSPSIEIPHRVHVQGAVTLQWPGRSLCIQQDSNNLCMDASQAGSVAEGSLIDAVGFSSIRDYKRTLEDASFRVAAGGPSPRPTPVTTDEALSGRFDAALVQIDGQLVGREHTLGEFQLMLRSGNVIISAILPSDASSRGMPDWKEGSVLRLTGICDALAGPDTWNLSDGELRPGSVRILLRGVDDVRILERPSWWTPRHALAILVATCLVSLAAFVWIVVLGHRVEQQTLALRKSEERLRHLSEHDVLTGLPNRLLLHDRLAEALQRAERSSGRLAILMVDLDRFKEINDVCGHQAGDKVLTTTARRLLDSVRLTDTVARIGGDEFVVLLGDLSDVSRAESIAAKIVAAVSAPVDIGSSPVFVTVSVGVCTYPEGGRDAETLMQNVDEAMYAAKTQGRNAFRVFMPVSLPT